MALAGRVGMRSNTAASINSMRGHMSRQAKGFAIFTAAVAALTISAAPLAAQGNGKRYAVSDDRAINVTRQVLVAQGYDVVEIETKGTEQIVYYRLGNKGKGKGQGKLQKMVIRRESNKVVFVDTPSTIMVDINVKLSL
jgi:hypothetical protein